MQPKKPSNDGIKSSSRKKRSKSAPLTRREEVKGHLREINDKEQQTKRDRIKSAQSRLQNDEQEGRRTGLEGSRTGHISPYLHPQPPVPSLKTGTSLIVRRSRRMRCVCVLEAFNLCPFLLQSQFCAYDIS